MERDLKTAKTMIDDAQQLLNRPKVCATTTPNDTHCQCHCQNVQKCCCRCCCCNCCCATRKSLTTTAATTINKTAQSVGDTDCERKPEDMKEEKQHPMPFDVAADIVEYRHKDHANNSDNSYLPMPAVVDNDDTGMRYSYKGVPPETYSAKKEFIYTRPLVEKQLVLKKTCEWWFYNNKCANMSTHWKRYAFLFTAICILLLLALIIFLSVPIGQNNDSLRLGSSTSQMMTTYTTPIITTTTTTITDDSMATNTTPYLPDLPNIRMEYINHSFIGDEQWSGEDQIENDINEEEIDNRIPDEFLHDYVKPRKVYNFTLNADDLLYESKRNSDNNNKDYFSTFSVTGTFRSESSQIWDPHPEYLLNVFGRKLHLVLHQDTSFIPPKTFRVLQILNNRTVEETDDDEGYYLGCYYKGNVQGDDQSAVAVSLCNGMSGYIKTSFGSLLIQPVNQTSEDDTEWIHKVWRHSRRNARHAVAGTLDFDLAVLEEAVNASLLSRRKRNDYNENALTLEVLLAVDRSVYNFHKGGLKRYIMTLMSMVSKIFDDASLGNNILITVTSFLKLNEDISTGRNASELLTYICRFLATQNYHYDTAMLITRDPICRTANEQKCDTLGLAKMGTVCKPHSCSIVQDNGLAAAFTIAHELGHILNMPHDDSDLCRPFNDPNKEQQLHIMSSIMTNDIHPFSWSNCSRYYVSEFLENMDRSCLEDTHSHYMGNVDNKQPGELYSLDQQCRLMLGPESRACVRVEAECKRLWCASRNGQSSCQSSNLPWADGTPCRNNHHWCQRGECVPRDAYTREVVHGGWGPWSAFTQCSLPCGGGVQESGRDCNNPLPANGGKYCKGSRKKFRSCNTHSCSPGSLDAREKQCADFNGRNITISGLDRGLLARRKWIPKYVPSENRCKRLYCRLEGDTGYFPLSERVIDGTTCSYDTFDKCVNGICRPAGCDNELNSLAKLDRCGVCEGNNNTCEEYTANFYVSNLYELQPQTTSYYYYVTTIPKGASNIVITQPGYHNVHYIVLRDDQNQSLLNGNKIISTYPNIVYYAGVMFQYNGATSVIERVNTTYSRKLKRDLIVEIISMNSDTNIKNDTLLMSYTYTYDKPSFLEPEVEIYRWEMQSWSNCDAICQGTSHRTPVCVSTTMARKVAPQLCEASAQPPTEYRNCNTECVLKLNVTSISECSASCGNWGTREKTHNCVQTFLTNNTSNIVDMTYCMAKMEISRHEPCREGCWDYTEWSQCSRTCATGTQVRSIACFINQTRVDESYCNPHKKTLNDVFRICTGSPCPRYHEENSLNSKPTMNNWITGDWGECSEKCEKNRTISCRYHNGYGCHADHKPLTKRKCCQIKYVSNWSNCSVECGNGIRRKTLHCARVYKAENRNGEVIPRRRVYIDPAHCRNLRVPTPKRTQKPCKTSCKWSTSDWTQCRADCKEEYQTRSVYCETMLSNVIAVKNCDASKKPISRKICNNCVRRQSRIVSSCTCDGYRRRRTVCYDSLRKKIPCPTKERIVKEKCQPPTDCQPQSCTDLRRIHRYYQDREYTIYIRGHAKRVYCHNMRDSPKEYITVNPIENYSIYYDYKSDNPDKCPPESRRRGYRDTNISSGRTSFHKIRVNITNLRVVEDDYTFATTIGIQQPLGSAGDCFNRKLECPQGDFSINIDRTGFTLKKGTMWERRGNYVAMKTSQTFETSSTARRAFCGGYCGRCAISHLGMYLEVV